MPLHHVIPFLVGCLISFVAALPATLILWAVRQRDLNTKLKAWAVGMVLRFTIIGAALLLLFRMSNIEKVPVVMGIVVIYFIILGFELAVAFRSN